MFKIENEKMALLAWFYILIYLGIWKIKGHAVALWGWSG